MWWRCRRTIFVRCVGTQEERPTSFPRLQLLCQLSVVPSRTARFPDFYDTRSTLNAPTRLNAQVYDHMLTAARGMTELAVRHRGSTATTQCGLLLCVLLRVQGRAAVGVGVAALGDEERLLPQLPQLPGCQRRRRHVQLGQQARRSARPLVTGT
jgi:hypothetical protein